MSWRLLSASKWHQHHRSTANTRLHRLDNSKDATQAEMYDHFPHAVTSILLPSSRSMKMLCKSGLH